MPDTSTAVAVADIDASYHPTQDEYLRQGLVSVLRKFASVDLRAAMERDFETRISPTLRGDGADVADWRMVEKAMVDAPSYRFYSTIRYNAQEMVWQSVQNAVERGLPEMISVADQLAARNPAGGSLRIDPMLEVPRYVSGLDVHLIPGSYGSEFARNDVAQGAVVSHGANVFYASMPHLRGIGGGVAESVARWLKATRPGFVPRRMLDLGTGIGRNLFPYLAHFSDVEAHGVDVGAPGLRYGNAVAARDGLPVHFSQQNAQSLDFPSGHFDLIVSSFFFHEVPVTVTRRILGECYRLLAPGGLMVHMELPPEKSTDAWENFRWNWDTANNNEPAYTMFRAQDPAELCATAGFAPDAVFEKRIPNYDTFGAENFDRFLRGEVSAPPHGAGGWFLFGAQKAA